ncbi:MAG: DNA recombination protein RmuC [Coriobacteriales bacterium]|jgi:DNA recombination protein RmuC|nr:DNA recombination protein RmuC [Coriobacteriales bacterium]
MDFLQNSLLIVAAVAGLAVLILILLIVVIVMLARRGGSKKSTSAETAERFTSLDGQMLSLQQGLDAQEQRFKDVDAALVRVDGLIREELGRNRQEMVQQQQATREETAKTLIATREETTKTLRENREEMTGQFKGIRETMEERLVAMQNDNAVKLEEMRKTVDEKLQETVEKRFAESFNLISERLEQVHKGLGEMQTLANGVGDLKKVLSNVKTRGNLGEYQLGAILEQILSPEQYVVNAQTKKRSQERVEFAIKLPGRSDDGSGELLLPIDSKFPIENYERLIDAYEGLGTETPDVIAKRLETSLKQFARSIRDKYLNPPRTTDFAILFVPTEGLYAEVLRMPGLFDTLQREFHVTVVGPTNLVAFLSSLQMGFRTLAVEKRSSEVWKLLGTVKTEFGRFADVLENVKKKLNAASNEIDRVGTRTSVINRKLRDVQALPASETSETETEALPPSDDAPEMAALPPAAEPPIELPVGS